MKKVLRKILELFLMIFTFLFGIIKKLFDIVLEFLKFLWKVIKKLIVITSVFAIIGTLVWILFFSASFKEWCELRMCNVVEYQLDKDDGISNWEMIKFSSSAAFNTLNARLNFDDTMTEDAFRHFSWNNNGVRDIGYDHVKIMADNHEYAFKITGDVLAIYEHQKDVYKCCDSKWKRFFAEFYAFRDAKNESCAVRRNYVQTILNDKDNVSNYIDGYTVMDLWNNNVGRIYGNDHPELSPLEAFLDAKENGLVILDRHTTFEQDRVIADYLEGTVY
ncbi:MAG: hypothetical protein MJ245_06590 [Clostridia bacterium]|nr:hypothetical protein [Clostridia bacterium]